MSFEPRFLATGIGSMPFTDAARAVELVRASLPQAPFWPQLPKLGLNEQMEIQFSHGMPRAVVDRAAGRLYFDTTGDYSEEFAAFYEGYMAAMEAGAAGDFSLMAVGAEYAAGLWELERQMRAGPRPDYVKVQVTGPCSFALTIVDENKRAMFYNEEFRDVIVKALAMKAAWQIAKFKPLARRVICFIDEPILSAFGSSTYVSVRREDIVSMIGELAEAIHQHGALAGVHCCGNTEWSILAEAGVDIINFDSWGYGETIAMYPAAIKAHLEGGGALAWGAVPTSDAVRAQTVEILEMKLEAMIDNLAARGVDRGLICRQALVTPSCGTGSMAPADAELVFKLTGELSARMRSKHG